MSVALVLVSHSAAVAEGLVEIAEQMAPDVAILAAGGTEDGRIGTSYSRVAAAVERAATTAGVSGVVILTDLGSATLTAAAVVDDVEGDAVRVVEGPVVEGAVAAAVAAQVGGDLGAVESAVVEAATALAARARVSVEQRARATEARTAAPAVTLTTAPPGAPAAAPAELPGPEVVRVAVLADPLGLHARPAALLARTVQAFDAAVTVEGVPGDSVLELLALGLTGGSVVVLTAAGSQADAALDAVVRLLASEGGPG